MLRRLLLVLLAVACPAAPAGAAAWLPPEVVVPRSGVSAVVAAAAADGTLALAGRDGADLLVATRPAGGGGWRTERLALAGTPLAVAAGDGGTLALAIVDGDALRLVTRAPGASALTASDPLPAGARRPALAIEAGRVLLARPTELGLLQTTGPVGGPYRSTSSSTFRRTAASAPVIAQAAGRPPLLAFTAMSHGEVALLGARLGADGTFGALSELDRRPAPPGSGTPSGRVADAALRADGSAEVLVVRRTAETAGGRVVAELDHHTLGTDGRVQATRLLGATDGSPASSTGTTMGAAEVVAHAGGATTTAWRRTASPPGPSALLLDHAGRAGTADGLALGGLLGLTGGAVAVVGGDEDGLLEARGAAGPVGPFGRLLATPGSVRASEAVAGAEGLGVAVLVDGDGGLAARVLDDAAPVLRLDEPVVGPDGTAALRADARDAAGPVEVRWDLGGGRTARGADVRTAFGPGRHVVGATATDGAGHVSTASQEVVVPGAPPAPTTTGPGTAGTGTAPPPAPATPTSPTPAPAPAAADRTPPAISGLRVRRRGRAATVRLTVSEAAVVRVRAERRVAGVRRGGRCTAGRTRGRARRCTRTVLVRTTRVTRPAGAAALRLRRLPRARLRLVVTATDPAGNRTTRTLALRA